MSAVIARDDLAKLVERMPAHLTVEQAVERIQLWGAIQEAEDDIRAGRVIPHEQVVKELKRWRK